MGSVGDGLSYQGQGLAPTVGNGLISENGTEKNLERSVIGGEVEVVSSDGNREVGGAEMMEDDVKEEGEGGEEQNLGKEEDGESEEDQAEEEDAVADAGRPKLDEGFYEIEAVRRKRVRKGVVQYLIKWRDWPETANTWEPVENLQSCSDVIETFEERLSSGKGSHRRRKRKSGVIHAQIRRKQPRSVGAYNIRSCRVRKIANSPATSAPTDDTSFAENPSSSEYNISGVDNKQSSENDLAVNSEAQLGQDNDGDLNMRLAEFRGGNSNDDIRADNHAIIHMLNNDPQPQEGAKVNSVQTTPSNHPITGSKKRKSGKVRRFIPDLDSHNRSDVILHPVPGFEGAIILENSNLPSFPTSNHKITEIIKPLSYAPPELNTVHDFVVTFLAMRSDGREVLVDNKFMKAYYPQQLINFYEKNLRYNPIS